MRIVKYLTVWDFTVYNTLESKILDSFSNWRKQNLDVTEYVQNEKDYFGFIMTPVTLQDFGAVVKNVIINGFQSTCFKGLCMMKILLCMQYSIINGMKPEECLSVV